MEDWHRSERRYGHPDHGKRQKGSFLGVVLILIGLFLIIRELGWQFGFPVWQSIRDFVFVGFHPHLHPIGTAVILLLVGLLLLSWRRVIGAIVIGLAFLFFLPHLFISGLLVLLFFPVLLIILGIIILSRLL